MGTPNAKRKVVNLSRYAEDLRNLKQAKEDLKKVTAYIKTLEGRLKKAAGAAEVAEVDGVEAFTYAYTDSYRWAEFVTENGDIAGKYKIKVEKEELDKEALLAEHYGLLQSFRTRQFLVK